MKNNSIFYDIEWPVTTDGEVEENVLPNITFRNTVRVAGIKELEKLEKEDTYKMTIADNPEDKVIDIHVNGIIAYLDEIQTSVETYMHIIDLIKVENEKQPKQVEDNE